ncbi:hypothetical protein [Pseudomonas syringae]|uniref:hypothetical protein n=1 Tax=Pseudomonas syringae TaxID=317 RepID=UPI001113590F|nr:hypothetical protein [Pseudomonas syringae]MCK0549935.1 hypothetical protein [Pseudomonas syringae pv. aptata]
MKPDSLRIKHLLNLPPSYAASSGIHLDDLLEKLRSSSGNMTRPLEEAEFFYLANRCVDSGLFLVSRDWVIQITRSGQDYLDPKTKKFGRVN